MSIALESLNHKVQRAAVGTMVDVALAHVSKDRQKAFAEMVDVAKQFYGDSFSEETYEHARAVLTDAEQQVVEAYQLCARPDRAQRSTHHGAQPWL